MVGSYLISLDNLFSMKGQTKKIFQECPKMVSENRSQMEP